GDGVSAPAQDFITFDQHRAGHGGDAADNHKVQLHFFTSLRLFSVEPVVRIRGILAMADRVQSFRVIRFPRSTSPMPDAELIICSANNPAAFGTPLNPGNVLMSTT